MLARCILKESWGIVDALSAVVSLVGVVLVARPAFLFGSGLFAVWVCFICCLFVLYSFKQNQQHEKHRQRCSIRECEQWNAFVGRVFCAFPSVHWLTCLYSCAYIARSVCSLSFSLCLFICALCLMCLHRC